VVTEDKAVTLTYIFLMTPHSYPEVSYSGSFCIHFFPDCFKIIVDDCITPTYAYVRARARTHTHTHTGRERARVTN